MSCRRFAGHHFRLGADLTTAIVDGTESVAPISPRVGAHAFVAENAARYRRLWTIALARNMDGGFSFGNDELLLWPHSYSARFEIDGVGLAPALALTEACRRFSGVLDNCSSQPRLKLLPALAVPDLRRFLEENFRAFAAGNRSLHVIARGASKPGTGFSEGMTGFTERVNTLAERARPGVGTLLDPQPYCSVRSPWRAPFGPHVATGL